MSNVNHPKHYNDGKIECIEFIEDKNLGFHLGNAVKYIVRAGKKDPTKVIEDLEKAVWYLKRYIEIQKPNPRKPNDMNPEPKHMTDRDVNEVCLSCDRTFGTHRWSNDGWKCEHASENEFLPSGMHRPEHAETSLQDVGADR
jgi:hypothetical protein